MDDKKISMSVVRRLPRYYRYLSDLLDRDITRISSKELSKKMNLTASQIRQDLNNFGCFGQQGYGYNIVNLHNEIKKILGLDKVYNLILIGAGNLGHALINHENFALCGFNFVALFDKNPSLIGTKIKDLNVLDFKDLKNFVEANKIDIAVLTVTKSEAVDVAACLIDNGIKSIWNFTNNDLQFLEKDDISVENIQLTDSLMTLSFRLNLT